MRAAHVKDAAGRATMLVMPHLETPGAFVLRIQGLDGDGAIRLDPEEAEEVARTIMAPTMGWVDGAWLEGKLRAAFLAGQAYIRRDGGGLVDAPSVDEYVAAELAKVAT
jgi:hypothetical protein